MKNFALLLVLVLTCLSPALAQTIEPPCWDGDIIIELAYSGDETLTLFNLPNGNGSTFAEAQLPDGTYVDATISMTLFDCFGDPIPYYPAEDLWLESLDGGLIPCIAGTIPDENTDENGSTYWLEPLMAGGSSLEFCFAFVPGILVGEIPLPLLFNSADMNGDGVVNLSDIGMFSEIFFGTYNFSADFFRDGQMNIADVGRMALGVGASCP